MSYTVKVYTKLGGDMHKALKGWRQSEGEHEGALRRLREEKEQGE